MSDEPGPPNNEEPAPPGRERVIFAAVAALVLAAIVGVVVVTGSSGTDGSQAESSNACIRAWNSDPIAPTQDGIHAYRFHGYRQTLVTRINADDQLIETPDDSLDPNDPDARCVVIFASPQPDSELEFGVRVFEKKLWVGLAVADRVPVEAIAALQAQAVPTANSTLQENGTIEDDG